MHTATFLQDLAVVMIVAGLVTIICHRFRQPVVLGYIIAGVIIGPHTPPFPLIHDKPTIDTLSELGVILLMFSIGLEFSLRKLRRVGGPAFVAAFLEILLMVWIGYQIGRLFTWSFMDSIFLGAMLSISSTTIIARSLSELGKSKEPFAQLIFGILIIEDVLAIVMIVLLSGIAMTGTLSIASVGATVTKMGVFLVSTLVVGLLAVPRLIGYVAKFKSNEMLLVTVLGLCFGFSLLATKLGYSVALGAFIIGAVIAESREGHRIEVLTEPVRDMFSAVFFVAIGLLIDPVLIVQHWLPVTVITIGVVLGQTLTCAFGVFVAGQDLRTSLRVGMGLAQIGEFSFIIAALGLSLNVTSGFLYPIAVAVSAITTLLNPYLIRNADGLVGWFYRVAPIRFVNFLGLYTQWVGQLGGDSQSSMIWRLGRQWFLQIGLNAALVAAIFAGAAYISQRPQVWPQSLEFGAEAKEAGLWLAAMILSLPLFIASFRKLQAFALLIAQSRVTRERAGDKTVAIRQVVEQTVLTAGVIVAIFFVLALSSTFLPSFKILLVLLGIIAAVAFFLRRSFIKIYSQGQVALRETLSQPPTPIDPVHTSKQLTGLLSEADLEPVTVTADSIACRKLIGELELRSRTGASIVGIERGNGARIINPGPDEELQAGDQVLLLGNRTQLNLAKGVLTSISA